MQLGTKTVPLISQQYITKAIGNSLMNQRCFDLHPGITCNEKFISQVGKGFQGVYKMYLFVHLIPFLLFKLKKTKKNPKKQLINLLVGFIKSICFGSLYSAILRRCICFFTTNIRFDGGFSPSIAGFLAGVALIFQSKTRQSEIALFALNKAMQSGYGMFKRRTGISMKNGESLLLAISISWMCYHYMNNRDCIRSSYGSVMDKLIGNI